MKTDRWSRIPGSNERYKERRRGGEGKKKHANFNLSNHAAVGPPHIIAVMWRRASVPPSTLASFAVTEPKCHRHQSLSSWAVTRIHKKVLWEKKSLNFISVTKVAIKGRVGKNKPQASAHSLHTSYRVEGVNSCKCFWNTKIWCLDPFLYLLGYANKKSCLILHFFDFVDPCSMLSSKQDMLILGYLDKITLTRFQGLK